MNGLLERSLGRSLYHSASLRRSNPIRSAFRQLRNTTTQTPPSRLERIEARLPRFLRRYVQPLRTAPLSHISAFLLLHELTAVVPLFGLAGLFHYTNWLPPFISEWAWVQVGVEKFGKYLRKKGWLGDEGTGKMKWWGRGEGGTRVVVELATAWAITKALLPARLVLSVWATPWFARWTVLPVMSGLRRGFRRGGKATPGSAMASPAAETGAIGGGVAAKNASGMVTSGKGKD